MSVLFERRPNGVVILTLNRPQQRNALTRALLADLQQQIPLTDAAALILTGSPPAFCAGADLKERKQMTADERGQHTDQIAHVADLLEDFPTPVLAAINGPCLAGGAELTLACDMRVASPSAVFAFPEIQLGIFPGAGGPLRLPRLIGWGAANSLLYTGRRIDAEEARQLGLVQAVTANTLDLALRWADQIAAAPPAAVRALKAALRASRELPKESAAEAVRNLRRSLDDSPEYVRALMNYGRGATP